MSIIYNPIQNVLTVAKMRQFVGWFKWFYTVVNASPLTAPPPPSNKKVTSYTSSERDMICIIEMWFI